MDYASGRSPRIIVVDRCHHFFVVVDVIAVILSLIGLNTQHFSECNFGRLECMYYTYTILLLITAVVVFVKSGLGCGFGLSDDARPSGWPVRSHLFLVFLKNIVKNCDFSWKRCFG